MKLAFLPLDKLCVSRLNMRHSRKAPDVSDILPTIRARGVLQPVIVRPCAPASGEGETGGEPNHEIVAGARRFHAAMLVERERAQQADHDQAREVGQMPCAILEEGDDADAIEASLIENSARLDPDEVARWECFTRLIREGRRPEDIAATFGLPDLAVRRVLALGNLLPRIRDLYRKEQIDAATVRHLTLASKSQQKAWLALVDDPDAYAPRGYQLKGWLFGGQSVPVVHALFDVAASGLAIIADLFGEDSYFADAEAFWTLQNAATEARRAQYLDEGWADAVVIGPDAHFHEWEYQKVPKRKGGRVYLDVRGNGEVIVHEGYLGRKEAARLARGADDEAGRSGGGGAKIARPELTSTLHGYLHLHRHAAVRAQLLDHPGIALRLMVAHAIVGSALWRVSPEPQPTRSDEVRASLDESAAEAVFDKARVDILDRLGFSREEPRVTGGAEGDLCGLFARLLDLSDEAVMAVIALVMGETLSASGPVLEATGCRIGVSMQDWWRADDAFFDLLRDREVLTAIVGEVAGEDVAKANAGEKGKVLKQIVRDCLEGRSGRERHERWVPRWMAFPPSAYTARGGVETVEAHRRSLPDGKDEDGADDIADEDRDAGTDDDTGNDDDAGSDDEGGLMAA